MLILFTKNVAKCCHFDVQCQFFFNIKKKYYHISYCIIIFLLPFFSNTFCCHFWQHRKYCKMGKSKSEKKLCCQIFLQKMEMTALCCEANFAKILWQKYFQKKKSGHSRMSIFFPAEKVLTWFFKKKPKKPTFYYTKSTNLVFFLRNMPF